MQSELERSYLSTQMSEAFTVSLEATSSTHDVLAGFLGTSKQTAHRWAREADRMHRSLIFASLVLFPLVLLFILKQRIAFW